MTLRPCLFAGALIAALLPLTGQAAFTSPKAVGLTLSDLPSGFHQSSGAFLSNAAFAKRVHFSKAQFDKHGRITGYNAEFTRGGTKGVTYVTSYVAAYRSASGARWDNVNSVKHDLTLGKRTSGPTIGEVSTAYIITGKQNGHSLSAYGIDFQAKTFSVTAAVVGYTGRVHLADVLRYARIVAARAH